MAYKLGDSVTNTSLQLVRKKGKQMTSFVKRVKSFFGLNRRSRLNINNILSSTMEDDDQQLTMMDRLSTECQQLREQLKGLSTPQEKEKVVLEYLQVMTKHETIADFPANCDWFNVKQPLSLNAHMTGKVVVLDFFTYCCINCMHILPDLAALELRFPVESGLVVVGVHSAKFANEKESRNIQAAAQRYNIAHPVVNDAQFRMWKALNVHCWPTLMILGPHNNPIFVLTGEGHADLLQLFVATSLKFYEADIQSHSLPIATNEGVQGHRRLLKFPAKVTCSPSGHIAVSDSGNNRILILSRNGKILETIGGGENCLPGFIDGNFTECRFNAPQGLCYHGEEVLFVADTENHAIRRIDLKQKRVQTVVGTGVQGTDYTGGAVGTSQAISSPWDVVIHKRDEETEMLLIAMAGTHQIWAYFLHDTPFWRGRTYTRGSCAAVAGNGHEQNKNNSYPNNAAFAQPSGLAMDTGRNELYVADSESSTVRKISMTDGRVQGVVGGDRNPQNLFAFGDVDGKLTEAKLQHPLGVCYSGEAGDQVVYVADTYNHKVKRIRGGTTVVETLAVDWEFNEPGGLCVDERGEVLIVANTNNHSIDLIDLKTGKGRVLEIREDEEEKGEIVKDADDLVWPERIVVVGKGRLRIGLTVQLEGEVHFTEGAPQKCAATLLGDGEDGEGQEKAVEEETGRVAFDWDVPEGEGRRKASLKIRLSLCKGDLCFPKSFTIGVDLDVVEEGGAGGDDDKRNVKQEVVVLVDKERVKWGN